MAPNKSLIFKQVPVYAPVAGEHLAVETRDTDIDTAPPGGLVLEVLYASLDPFMRGRMRGAGVRSFVPGFQPGAPMNNHTVSRVRRSDSPDWAVGDLVRAVTPIAQYARLEAAALAAAVRVRNPAGLPLGFFLGPLGLPGLTAWSGLYRIGRPVAGETLFVSSAAGAVGQVVGQIAKRDGLRVIGSVGSDAKLAFIVDELGFDAGFNYNKETPADALQRLAPNGIDIYFDNVGAEHLDAALWHMKDFGRIPACGMVSGYNLPPEERKPIRNLTLIIPRRVTIEGFVVSDPAFGLAYAKEHQEKVQQWLADGSLKAKLSVTEGIKSAPDALVGMLEGKNFGKVVVQIADLSTKS